MESHHHEHTHRITSLNKAFIIGIVLNLSFVIVEFGVGFYYNSLGLLSDAGHNLGDVASLILAMLAFRLEKIHSNSRYTYGYKKSTILVSLLNAVILLVAVGIIIAESIDDWQALETLISGKVGIFSSKCFELNYDLTATVSKKISSKIDNIYKKYY